MPEIHIPLADKLREAAEQAKISKSSIYEIYDKFGRGQSSFSSDNLQPEAEKNTLTKLWQE